MATPPSDDTRALFKLIADGQWHDYEEIRDKIAAAVPPGRALRKYQERIEYARKYKGDPNYDTDLSEDERIYLGAKACGQIAISNWKGRGVQYDQSGERKRIRIKPGFSSWGLEAQGVPTPTLGDSVASEPAGEGFNEAPGEPPGDREPAAEDPAASAARQAAIAAMRFGLMDPEERVIELTAEQDRAVSAVFEEHLGQVHAEFSAGPVEDSDAEYAEYGLQPVTGQRSATQPGEPQHSLNSVTEESPRVAEKVAFFSESEVRHIIREEVAMMLDGFQKGMQDYLDTQFDLLNEAMRARNQRRGRWFFDPNGG